MAERKRTGGPVPEKAFPYLARTPKLWKPVRISGFLDDRMVEMGSLVAPGTPVARVLDTGTVKVSGGVPERFSGQIERGTQVEIAIEDTGPGIAPENLGYIFKLFAQDEQQPSAVHGGLGIGLSLVYQLVQQHGGEVSAFSTGEAGKGVEFMVWLPLIEAPG